MRCSFFLLILLVFCSGIQIQTVSPETPGIKGLWVTRDYLADKGAIAELVDTAKRLGFNALFIQVRGRGDAYYNSEIVPKAESLSHVESFDPLDYVIHLAEIYDIQVHAWFNMFYLWSSTNKPESTSHLSNNYPEWMCRDINGKSMFDMSQNELRKKGIEGIYLSPENKNVQIHLLEVIKEVVRNYEIDGVHLDYIRYPGKEFGFSESNIREYMDTYYINPVSLLKEPGFVISRNGEERYRELFDSWNTIKGNKISEFVAQICNEIKDIKNTIILSAAVKANVTDARNRYSQFWDEWISKGIIDFAVPMNYVKSSKEFTETMKEIFRLVPPDKILMGISIYNSNGKNIKQKMASVSGLPMKGIVIFSYDTIKRNKKMFTFFENLNRFNSK